MCKLEEYWQWACIAISKVLDKSKLYCGSDFTPIVKILVMWGCFLLFCLSFSFSFSFSCFFVRGQLHQQCCEEWTLVSEETQAKMARMAAAAAWGLGEGGNETFHLILIKKHHCVSHCTKIRLKFRNLWICEFVCVIQVYLAASTSTGSFIQLLFW